MPWTAVDNGYGNGSEHGGGGGGNTDYSSRNRSSRGRRRWRSRASYQPLILLLSAASCLCNPDAKRLYDDLLSNYNRLIRPVSNNTDTVLVKLGLRLSQLIELVRSARFVRSDNRGFGPVVFEFRAVTPFA